MPTEQTAVLLLLFALLTLANLARVAIRGRFPLATYLGTTWAFFLCFAVTRMVSLAVGVWVLALVSFVALREYFSLINVRLQDRVGILGAYLAIPFMFYFVLIDWYGMFIISIPVYAFLAIPLLITLGGRQVQGTVFSIGAIDFGLFLFVFCMGHVGYLMRFSIWMAVMLILSVALCDIAAAVIERWTLTRGMSLGLRVAIAAPFVVALTVLLSPWTAIPLNHSIWLGLMIPVLAVMGQHTSGYIEADLGIREDDLLPGRGQYIDNLKSLLFAAPVVFHYIRYFLT
ncbi:MAG TPA: hypothetical protein VM118_09080 [Acidobacteriota bacterium]|nr:hypothetical protein [Acidobacteriota bacterium]